VRALKSDMVQQGKGKMLQSPPARSLRSKEHCSAFNGPPRCGTSQEARDSSPCILIRCCTPLLVYILSANCGISLEVTCGKTSNWLPMNMGIVQNTWPRPFIQLECTYKWAYVHRLALQASKHLSQ
jgi:hypothetical protein